MVIATLPEWVPGLLTLQPLPVLLLVLVLGNFTLSKRATRIRELVGSQDLGKARSSSLLGTILGFTVGGFVPGPSYLFLYTRLGKAMVKRTPSDSQVTTVYLPSQPSGGLFLGRYIGWLSMYLFVLYIGYTQLPAGLRGVSDWLSPVLGIHFNTLIVTAYLLFSNPLTNPSVFWLWATAGLTGGMIAGGRIGRGFMVGLTIFLSTLGAMGLAALAIFRGFFFSFSFASIPPPPPNFSLTALATGPIAQDLIPILLRPGVSFADQTVIRDAALVIVRNAGLAFAIVTISGRAGALAWQAGFFALKAAITRLKSLFALRKTSPSPGTEATAESKAPVKASLLLLLALMTVFISFSTAAGAVLHAGPTGPYQQYLGVGFDRLGAPNASLSMTNLDLSSKGIVFDNNYDQSNFTVLMINNGASGIFGNSQFNGFPLGFLSQPVLITMYSTDAPTALARSNAVASQFSQALGTQFNYALSIPTDQLPVNLYSPGTSVSNNDMLNRVLNMLPSGSFSGLFSPGMIEGQKYSLMIGWTPKVGNYILSGSFSLMLNVDWPRQYFKDGPHQFSLNSLLGTSSGITGTPGANVSIVTVSFQRGTIVTSYSPLPPNAIYDPTTYTLVLNASSTSAPDLTANFNYPFAPNIQVQKTVSPGTGSVGLSHTVTFSVENKDTVPVTAVNVTDAQAVSAYRSTLSLSPDTPQSLTTVNLSPGQRLSASYSAKAGSSGVYSLSSARGEFVWTLPNGTAVRYTVVTEEPTLNSQSGPDVQFSRTFADLQPYSYLLILGFALPPIKEGIGFLLRRRNKGKGKVETTVSAHV